MENCEILQKSVLKKPNLSVRKKGKRVTFCSTVKVFLDEFSTHQKSNIVDLQLNCVEVNIVDKSSEDAINCIDVSKNDDCNATDFLVHKVIYENDIHHEDDDADTDALSEEADESSVLFETNTEDEGLQFVVHKVTDHEDDLIQQELELDDDVKASFCEEMECDNDIIGKLSELSIENILAHDKIIAFIDQNTFGLSSLLKSHINTPERNLPLIDLSKTDTKSSTVSSCCKNSELVLSPPLQELSIDKIVKAQSGNALCELDISPLNSIQETDSDSDVSSEGTMIMMTSEESEKNEQHIRESFLKYESMKKEKEKVNDPNIILEAEENAKNIFENMLESVHHANFSTDKENPSGNSELKFDFEEIVKDIASDNKTEYNVDSVHKHETMTKLNLMYSSNMPSCDNELSVPLVHESKKIPFTPVNNSCYWDKSLESIQIPKDVREWKIHSSPEKITKSDSSPSVPVQDHKNLSLKVNTKDLQAMQESSKSDELEKFVLASKERVQRIRKRYSDKAQKKSAGSPVRGIRPRFGSTAEILQLVQKQNHPIIAYSHKSHVSWPCNSSFANCEINIHNRRQLNHMFGCQSLPSECSSQSSLNSSVSEDSICDHDSVSSCPSIFFQERGVPEGASPPRSLSEDSVESYINEENPNNIVYFSMKV